MPTIPAAAEDFDDMDGEPTDIFVVYDAKMREIGRFGPVALRPNAEDLAFDLLASHPGGAIECISSND